MTFARTEVVKREVTRFYFAKGKMFKKEYYNNGNWFGEEFIRHRKRYYWSWKAVPGNL